MKTAIVVALFGVIGLGVGVLIVSRLNLIEAIFGMVSIVPVGGAIGIVVGCLVARKLWG